MTGARRIEKALKLQRECALCPRKCRVDRERQAGYCGETVQIRAARAALHRWEEPCISGERGSGAVFFTGCPLRCVFCQNRSLARGEAGAEITTARLSEIFLELEHKGAHNLNLVTPTHFAPQILEALELAKGNGLKLPVVYNCGGYEEPETVKLLEGGVDIYLPDFKYKSGELSGAFSGASDYFEKACAALAEMVRQAGSPVFGEDGLMKRGVIVRHLILPGCTKDSIEVIRYLHETYGNSIYLSILNQYTPLPHTAGHPKLGRRVTRREYEKVVDAALSMGVENGFIQEGKTASESFIPEFSLEGI